MNPQLIYRRVYYYRFENLPVFWVIVPNKKMKPEEIS